MNVLQFDSEAHWVDAISSLWRDRLRENPKMRLCLASGHTPLKVYRAMAKSHAEGRADFSQAQVFALDEYGGLDPQDEARCANMLTDALLREVALPRGQFHLLDPDAIDLDRICREYDAAIGAGFDLAILGLGLNGHIGMNEPGSTPDLPTRRVQLHPTTVQSSAKYLSHFRLPTWGIGVGLKQLLAAKEIWLLANGPAKAEIVARILKEAIGAPLPATWLRQHGNSSLFLDPAAAAQMGSLGFDA